MANDSRRTPDRRIAAVRTSPIHGSGLFALRHIGRGKRIGFYEGRRYGPDEELQCEHGLVYVFRLTDGTVIDDSQDGSDVRHINHCCEPNCAAYEVEREDGSLAIVIETLRPVQEGQELLLDYALDPGEADARNFACRCGASTCRGTMLAV